MIPLFGLLGRRDPRAHAIVDAIVHDLGAGSFVYRYEPDGADGFVPGEAAFVPVCWWAVSALARLGRVDEARTRLDDLCRRLPRLLAEEIDPVTDESLGNVPLVWSHTELARALYIVDAAERRRRWTPVGLLAWRVGRYARLRWTRR
jgi:GH15 family glucan-1,4-alpha-glucosidase